MSLGARAVRRGLPLLSGIVFVGAGFSAETDAKAAAGQAFYAARIQPIFEQSCVVCHGPEKSKAGLRLDSYAAVLKGGEAGPVVVASAPEKSELYRRITLAPDDDEVMPSDGKKLLAPVQARAVYAWIRADASETASAPGAELANEAESERRIPMAPDYRPFLPQMSELERRLSIRLAPVSQDPTDGIILRTATAPQRVDDALVAQLAPIAALIVDAELSRTQITDGALQTIAGFANLRRLDVSHTQVTSAGVAHLASLMKLQSLILVATAVDNSARATLQRLPALRSVYAHGTPLQGTVAPGQPNVEFVK